MTDIELTKLALDKARKALEEAEKATSVARMLVENMERTLIYEMYSVKDGTIVLSNGKEYQVCGITTFFPGKKPWLKGHPKRKNGTFSSSVQYIYDWELKEM